MKDPVQSPGTKVKKTDSKKMKEREAKKFLKERKREKKEKKEAKKAAQLQSQTPVVPQLQTPAEGYRGDPLTPEQVAKMDLPEGATWTDARDLPPSSREEPYDTDQ